MLKRFLSLLLVVTIVLVTPGMPVLGSSTAGILTDEEAYVEVPADIAVRVSGEGDYKQGPITVVAEHKYPKFDFYASLDMSSVRAAYDRLLSKYFTEKNIDFYFGGNADYIRRNFYVTGKMNIEINYPDSIKLFEEFVNASELYGFGSVGNDMSLYEEDSERVISSSGKENTLMITVDIPPVCLEVLMSNPEKYLSDLYLECLNNQTTKPGTYKISGSMSGYTDIVFDVDGNGILSYKNLQDNDIRFDTISFNAVQDKSTGEDELSVTAVVKINGDGVKPHKTQFSGNSSASPGSETEKISFSLNTLAEDAQYFSGKIYYPETFELKSVSAGDFAEIYAGEEKIENGYKYFELTGIYDYDGLYIPVEQDVNVFEIDFRIPEDIEPGSYKITCKDARLYGSEEYSASDAEFAIVVEDIFARMDSLETNTGIWSEEFNPGIREYTVYVPENTESITLTPAFTKGVLRPNGTGLWISGNEMSFSLNEKTTVIELHRELVTGYLPSVYRINVVKFTGTRTEVSEDGKDFLIKGINISSGNAVIMSLYKNNILSDVRIKLYDGEDIVFEAQTDYDSAKVVVWKSVESMLPVCKAESVDLKATNK